MAKPKIYKDKKEFDKANQLYLDSLALYNQGENAALPLLKKGFTLDTNKWNDFQDDIKIKNKKIKVGEKNGADYLILNKNEVGANSINSNIKPIKVTQYTRKGELRPTLGDEYGSMFASGDDYWTTAKYKKPTQKPIYQPDKYQEHLITEKDWQDINTNDYGAEEAKIKTVDLNKYDIYRTGSNTFDIRPKKLKKPVQPVILEDKPKLNTIQSLPLSPIPVDNKTNIQIPKQEIVKPKTKAIDARTYTAGKYLKNQGKSSGYINEGDGTGRQEVYANGGWLDSFKPPKSRIEAETKEEAKRLNKSNEVKLTDKGLSKSSQNFIDYIRPDVYDKKQVLNLLTKNKKYTEEDYNKIQNFEVDGLEFNTSLKGDRDAQLINQGFNQKYNTFEKYKGNNNDYKIKDYEKQKVVDDYFDKEKIIKKYANNPLGNYDLEYADIDKKVFSSRDRIYKENNFSKDVKGYKENKRFTLRDDIDSTFYPNKNAFGIMGKFTAKNNTNDKTKKYPYISINDKIDYDFAGDVGGAVTDLMYPQNRFGIKDTIYYNPKTHKVINNKSKIIKNYSQGGWLDDSKQVPSTLAVKTNVIPKEQIMFPDKYINDKDSFKKDYSKYLKNKYDVSIDKNSELPKKIGARAFFNPLTDNINYKAMNTVSTNEDLHILLDEIPHKIQKDKYGTASFLYNIAKDKIKYPKKNDVYKVPGTLEHEAHLVINPKLKNDYNFRYQQIANYNTRVNIANIKRAIEKSNKAWLDK